MIQALHSQLVESTCANCKQNFKREVWLIINFERPENIVKRLQIGALHVIECPYCGQKHHFDFPLLLLVEHTEISLIFSPAEASSIEQDQKDIAQLKEIVRKKTDTLGLRSITGDERLNVHFFVQYAFKRKDLENESKLLIIPRKNLVTILTGLAHVEYFTRQDAVEKRKVMDKLSPSARAHAIIEAVLTDNTYVLQPEDINLTLLAVLAEVKKAMKSGSEQVKELERFEATILRANIRKPPQLFHEAVNDYANELKVSINALAQFSGKHHQQFRRLGKDEKHYTFTPGGVQNLIEAPDLMGKPLRKNQKELWEKHLKTSSLYTILVVAAHKRTESSWPQVPEDYDFLWETAYKLAVRSAWALYHVDENASEKIRKIQRFLTDDLHFIFRKWSEQHIEGEDDIVLALEERDQLGQSDANGQG